MMRVCRLVRFDVDVVVFVCCAMRLHLLSFMLSYRLLNS